MDPCVGVWTDIQFHNGIPFLESLKITCPYSHQLLVPPLFADAPALRKFTGAPSLVVRIALPWTQIVELNTHVYRTYDRIRTPEEKKCFFDIIAIAPLRLLASNDKTMDEFPNTGITKPDVEIAQLPPNWLPHFTLPALRKYIHRADAHLTTAPIREFILRSKCTLTHLDIRDANPSRQKAEALEALFKAVPQLQELELYIPSNPDDMDCLPLMLQPLKNKVILPELRVIRLRVSAVGYFPNSSLWCGHKCLLLHVGLSIVESKRKALWCMELDSRGLVWNRSEGVTLEEKLQARITNGRERLLKTADAMRIDLYLVE
ncbi:hypothetical protein CYLTODRAFT_126068 [Cylindrobasidium torrendii FP15055 ss-10]|uniref:Uncharacterized protein n=1 Tax=Cylindrobasidium torrendii FP15055 ss-10 TaxID=1314674 RepID=A0A0D7B0U5_9AGAR|nr:hypothetical protein CYLTODRAFT_126068 [Cylindrobasidium torrendii FP15055 ss-10]